jgi:hypothetical protein
MWVIDIRHWLNETRSGPAVPQLKLKVKKLSEIITYATSSANDVPASVIPKCWRRPKRRPCNEALEIDFDASTGQIHWYCPICHDEGVITGWEGLIWDMSDAVGPMQ